MLLIDLKRSASRGLDCVIESVVTESNRNDYSDQNIVLLRIHKCHILDQ